MRAISFFRREDGMGTTPFWAVAPLRRRVRKSATGSVMLMALPARLRHAGDVAVVGELAQADPAQAELAEHRTRAAATAAPRVLAGLELGGGGPADAPWGLGPAAPFFLLRLR